MTVHISSQVGAEKVVKEIQKQQKWQILPGIAILVAITSIIVSIILSW
ncbi:MAG: hypothetical protein HQ530_03005 [Parcubacteria group bacterium]|nr:hypothetical protein [Parcubacteria group bacterium]